MTYTEWYDNVCENEEIKMATINIKFSKKDYKVICDEINYWYNLNIKPTQMEDILTNADKYVLIEIATELKDISMGFATSVREDIADIISEKLTKMRWPNYATTNKNYDIWLDRFVKGCKKYNYGCWDKDEIWGIM